MVSDSPTRVYYSCDAKFYALFCTTQIPAELINDLLVASDNSKLSTNLWSLIRTHDQKFFDKPTTYPIEGGNFTTSFINSSIADLGAFCCEHFDRNKRELPAPYISWAEFAVLDARTLEDNTVMMVKWEFWSVQIDLDSTEEKYEDHEGWQTIRVPMKGAAEFMYGITETLVQEFKEHLKPEDEGVFTLAEWE